MKFNYCELKELLSTFHYLTGIKVAIKNISSDELIGVPKENCRVCSLIRNNSKAKEQCNACERSNLKLCEKIGGLVIYKCHLGLTEAIFPLKVGNVINGYIIMGQLLESRSPDVISEIVNNAEKYGITISNGELQDIIAKTPEEIKASAKILEALAHYMLIKNMIKEDFSGIAYRINNYIAKNLALKLSVDNLCREFSISRNMLYKISNKYFGMPIASYIRRLKVEKAADLIRQGYTITDAASATGFSDYSYFTKVVKSELGILPSKIK